MYRECRATTVIRVWLLACVNVWYSFHTNVKGGETNTGATNTIHATKYYALKHSRTNTDSLPERKWERNTVNTASKIACVFALHPFERYFVACLTCNCDCGCVHVYMCPFGEIIRVEMFLVVAPLRWLDAISIRLQIGQVVIKTCTRKASHERARTHTRTQRQTPNSALKNHINLLHPIWERELNGISTSDSLSHSSIHSLYIYLCFYVWLK